MGFSFFIVGVITMFNAVLIYLGMAYPAHAYGRHGHPTGLCVASNPTGVTTLLAEDERLS